MQHPTSGMFGSGGQWEDWDGFNGRPPFQRGPSFVGSNSSMNHPMDHALGVGHHGRYAPGALVSSSMNVFGGYREPGDYHDFNGRPGQEKKFSGFPGKPRKGSAPDSNHTNGGKHAVVKKIKTGMAVIKALLARSMFLAHSGLVVWRLMDVMDNDWPYLLLALVGLVVIETFVTVCLRKGQENQWFSVCILLFLLAVVPGLWLLELDRLDRYKDGLNANSTIQKEAEALSQVKGVQLPVVLEPDLWVLALEQMLLFILIIARWILPKGNISRNQLSVLLLVYIGMASDIMDIFVLFEEPEVLDDDLLGSIILAVWAFSLLQFCLVLTVTKGRRPRMALTKPDRDGQEEPSCMCCETEIWSILTTIIMQDGPFLAVRLWIMIKYNTFNYSLLFFSFKNALVILLQLYRLVIVLSEDDLDEPKVKRPHQHSNEDLYRYM